MQTTVNDIASLFMGNPGALQNRIQKEQQAKPGIPPDLKELLALQQIQEQLQASQQQQALQNPQNQPTVAQSLQQAAKQALMARQVQAQQQQMARSGLPMAVPQGLPQPQRQPEMGLDQIQSNLGEYYGGGIVAFNGKDGSDVKDESAAELERLMRPAPDKNPAPTEKDILAYMARKGEKINLPKPPQPAASGLPEILQKPLEAPAETDLQRQINERRMQRMNVRPEDVRASGIKTFKEAVPERSFAEEEQLIKELEARRANIGKGTNPLMDLLEGIATTAPGRGGILSQGAEGVRNARAMQAQREQQNMDMLKEILGQKKAISTGKRADALELYNVGDKAFQQAYKESLEAESGLNVSENQKQANAFAIAKNARNEAMDLWKNEQTQKRHAQDLAARREIAMMKDKEKSEIEKVIESLQAKNPDMPYHEAYEKAKKYNYPAAQINAQTQQDKLQLARDRLTQSNPLYKDAMDIASDPNSKPKDVERAKKIMENIEALNMRGSQSEPPAPASPASSSGAPSDIPSINNNDDYNKLKPGQQYRDPQGNLRTKG
jgi:hypothetical protein